MALLPAAPTIMALRQPPSDAETLTLAAAEEDTETAAIDAHIDAHPAVAALRASGHYTEMRPHLKIPRTMWPHNLTAGVLRGPGRVAAPPLAFFGDESTSVMEEDVVPAGASEGARAAAAPDVLPTESTEAAKAAGGKEGVKRAGAYVEFAHFGADLCGHPGIVHGGLLATVLDEALARASMAALPHRIAMTASLTVNYRAPCPAGSYVVVRCECTRVEGRKAWVRGRIETLADESKGEKPLLVAEAEALMVSPRAAAQMARFLPV
jgi:acyl-coenzyme A thioesterase PaaI-like protein